MCACVIVSNQIASTSANTKREEYLILLRNDSYLTIDREESTLGKKMQQSFEFDWPQE